MPFLYYIGNLIFTSLTLLPALSGIFYHLPLSKKLIHADLINNGGELLKINYKRIIIFSSVYIIFIIISLYFLGVGALISTAINLALCISVGWNKIFGKNGTLKESFLSANEKYFKNTISATTFINEIK